jgi:hypothetical protein
VYGAVLPSLGTTVDSLVKRGVHAYFELVSNLVGNAHLVPAGIVAVNRAPERGYSFANAG